MGADATTVDTRTVKTNYFATDPENPVWVFWFSSVREKGMSVEEKRSDITNVSSFEVEIHAYSGAVVSSNMDSPIESAGRTVQGLFTCAARSKRRMQ